MKTKRKEALAAGDKRYFTGKACKRGHVDRRYAISGTCFSCNRLCRNAWRKANPEKASAEVIAWRKTNFEKEKVTAAAWQKANAAKCRASSAAWDKANPGKACAKTMKRHAAKLQRTPSWADLEAIEAFYVARPEGFHVDHKIPLRGEFISGLHVLNNLQYLLATENIAKGNRLDLAAPELL